VVSEVTPEGYIYTSFGETHVFHWQSIMQRIKARKDGYLPMVQYQIETNGLIYQFTMFAADLGGGLTGMPVNFVRFQVRNSSAEPRAGLLASAFRVDPPQTYVLLLAGQSASELEAPLTVAVDWGD
jgi:hypothetical protein